MTTRILRDIRFYETENENTNGKNLPSNLGKLFTPTREMTYIGQRIARKLNELEYHYGGFDHIYITLSTFVKEGEIILSDRNLDPRIQYIDCGVNAENFNTLDDTEKNSLIQSMTLNVFKKISSGENLEKVLLTEKLMTEFGSEIKIHYKSKDTLSHRIDLYYQIEAANGGTKAIIECKDKKTNSCYSYDYQLRFYDEIYTLVDSIHLKGNSLLLKPKKSVIAQIQNQDYVTPIQLDLADFKAIDCP